MDIIEDRLAALLMLCAVLAVLSAASALIGFWVTLTAALIVGGSFVAVTSVTGLTDYLLDGP